MFITFLLFSCQEDNPNNFSIFESEAKPASCEEDSLQFYPENLPDLAPRERDISYHDEGPSVAILDHDNDGVDSIIQCFPDERTYLYRSSGRTELSLPCGKILVEDLNSDGWQDLVIAFQAFGEENTSSIYVYQNIQGEFNLENSFSTETRVSTIHSADLNQDGFIDLALFALGDGNENDQNLIAWGESSWTFNISESSALLQGKTFDAVLADFNQDGFVDIYAANDQGYEFVENVFWWNRDGELERDISCQCYPTQNAMGAHFGDFDRDGWLDLLTSDTDNNHLLAYYGDELFVDMSLATNASTLNPLDMSWGIQLVDVNNDGWLDIFSALGDQIYEDMSIEPQFIGAMQASVALRTGDSFSEAREQFGFTEWGSFRSIVPFHWNGDGILDYWITDVENAPLLMVSNLCSDNNWLEFTGPNHTAIKFWTGEQIWYGEINNNSSYGASRSPHWHVGLGDKRSIQNIMIRLPGKDWTVYAEELSTKQRISLNP